MTIKGRRIFNYRPAVIFALALTLGIILGEAVLGVHVALTVCVSVLAFLFAVFLLCFKNLRRFVYIPLALLAGFIGITVSASVYINSLVPEYSGKFTATVASEISVEDSTAKFYISDIRAGDLKFKYKSIVFASASQADFDAGDTVEFEGKIIGNPYVKFDGLTAYAQSRKIGYRTDANSVRKLASGDPDFPLSAQLAIKKVIYENTDNYTSGICIALLLGDKGGIDGDDYENIADSGLAHVLAVSGLHVTALASALYFLLRKLKVKPKISLIAVTLITFLYSMICGFTPSSVRAVIMTATLMFASSLGIKKDNLSSLAVAGSLILLFRPSALMELGFLLSFSSVFGIFAFYPSFQRIGMRAVRAISPKRNFGKRFFDVCALSLATNLATLPLVAYFFGKVSTVFILSNFIVLPYIMAIYAVLMILTLFSLITTVGGFVGIMRFLLFPFKAYVSGVGGFALSSVPVSASVLGIICYFAIMLFVSKYNLISRRAKFAGASLATAVSIALCMLVALL